jgi:hypothetical protein
LRTEKRERQKKKKKKTKEGGGGSERCYRGGQENITPVWKVPRQCPLVLLVWVTCTFFFIYFFINASEMAALL